MKDWSSNETLEENLQKEESSSVKLLEGESKASDRRGGGGGGNTMGPCVYCVFTLLLLFLWHNICHARLLHFTYL